MKTTTLTIITAICLLSMISMANALIISNVNTAPDTIAPGQNADVAISLKNNADVDIEDVSVSLDFTNVPFAPYESGSDYNTNEILEGKTKDASFKIIALNDAKSGIYKIPVNIVYTEDSQQKTKTSLISMTINSKPILETSVEDGLFLKGQNNKVSLKVVNKGLADVKFMEINVDSSTYYNLLSQNKVYIGDVDSNDFQTADFQILFNNNAPSVINLPVSITYKDITYKEYNEDFDIQLKVYSQEQAQNLGLVSKSNTSVYIIVVVVIVIIFFIYRWFRRRRKRNQEY